MRIGKGYKWKIVSIIISITFLFNTTLYSCPLSKDTLRVHVGQPQTYKRITEINKSFRERVSRFLVPYLDEKSVLKQQIENLGGDGARTISGWQWVPAEYLEDTLIALKLLDRDSRAAVQHIHLVPWYRSLKFWLGQGGYAKMPRKKLDAAKDQGIGSVYLVSMPERGLFQWILAHELSHFAEHQKPEVSSELSKDSWRKITRDTATLRDKAIFGGEVVFALVVNTLIIQAAAGLIPGFDQVPFVARFMLAAALSIAISPHGGDF